jgi:hypothetical protein
MRLIFIYGLPATGKLTVAEELAKRTGFRLFHNHLVVDLLLGLFEFGSEPFVELRERIWLSVFEQAAASGLAGMIFTFAPERTVRPGFAERAVEVVELGGGRVDFVELTCPVEELKQRMGSASRLEFQKLNSVELFDQLLADGALDSSYMPKAAVNLDTNECSPAEAAERIATGLGLAG